MSPRNTHKEIQFLNPFVNGTNIPDEYFCDRVSETEQAIDLLKSGSNIVMKAPRRIGKSSLINHILNQQVISNEYHTVYVDLLGTSSAADFVREFQNALMDKAWTRVDIIKEYIKEVPGKIYLDHDFSASPFETGLKVKYDYMSGITLSIRQIFNMIENCKKPVIVVFDEFQQIKYYQEPMTAILRSYIQQMNNARFIFSGSSRRMLSQMFTSSEEPFCRSAEPIDLDIISLEKYSDFCVNNFVRYGKEITTEAIEFAYHLCAGNTYDLQRIMRLTFSSIERRERADLETVKAAIENILSREDQGYRERMNMLLNTKERSVLIAIAMEGVADNMTSHARIRQYQLGAASSVLHALNNLSSEEKYNMVLRIGQAYILQDKMFELWIARQYGCLEMKYACAEQQFLRQRSEMATQMPALPGLKGK